MIQFVDFYTQRAVKDGENTVIYVGITPLGKWVFITELPYISECHVQETVIKFIKANTTI